MYYLLIIGGSFILISLIAIIYNIIKEIRIIRNVKKFREAPITVIAIPYTHTPNM